MAELVLDGEVPRSLRGVRSGSVAVRFGANGATRVSTREASRQDVLRTPAAAIASFD